MNLYIQIENGQPVNHPALEDNLLQAFLEIPAHWEKFARALPPVLSVYQTLVSDVPTYEKVDGIWTDVWTVRDMTAEEKADKQQRVRDEFNMRPQAANWAAWTLDEATCTMQPPIPRPPFVAGEFVFWCGADNNWKQAPDYPVDGGKYIFDFFAWQWAAL